MTGHRERRSAESLRILTFNLFGQHACWDDRRRVIQDGLARLAPDLMTLQETVVTDTVDQVRELVGEHYQIVHSRKRADDGIGISTVSRWPIADMLEVDLAVSERHGDFPCTALLTEIDAPAPSGPIVLVNHFPDWQLDHEVERERQAVIVVRAIEEFIGEQPRHVILAGDLDATPLAASLRFLAGKQSLEGLSVCYRDAWESVHPGEPGATFSPRDRLMSDANWDWPFQQIDHILVRCGEHGGPTLAISDCQIAFTEPDGDVWASDHFALVADLAVPSAVD